MNIIKLFVIGFVATLKNIYIFIKTIDNYLKITNIRLHIMEQEQEQEHQQQPNQRLAEQQQEEPDGNGEAIVGLPEPMDVDSDNDTEEDDEDEEEEEEDVDEDDEEEEDDDDDDMPLDEDSDYTYSEIGSYLRTTHFDTLDSLYTFKPLRLVRCYYTMRNSSDNNSKTIPIARSGHRVIASESHLYSLGGYNPGSASILERLGLCQLFQELWSYNFATNRWKLVLSASDSASIPTELASTALAIYNNVLISHGGTGYPFGDSCSNDCYVYTTSDDNPIVSRLKVTGDLPTAQYGPGITIHKNYLYTIGGTTGYDYSCDVYRLDLNTKVWENVYICRPEIRDDPEGRYRHEVVYDGQYIFVLGGGTSISVYDLKRLPAFNLVTNTWEYFDTLPDRTVLAEENRNTRDVGYPKPRKCFSCVQHTLSNGDIEAFIAGGLQADFKTYFGDIWKLNLRSKQWTLIRTAILPKPLYFHSAAQAGNGCMYIFGGIEYSDKEMRRRKNLFKMWLTIPKLTEICWDAITYYNENLNCFDQSTLLKAGIPNDYLKRLPPQEKTFPDKNARTVYKTCAISKRFRLGVN